MHGRRIDSVSSIFCHAIRTRPANDRCVERLAPVQEFWGSRYNTIVSSVLRDSIYCPVMEGCLVRQQQPQRGVTTRSSSSSASGGAARPSEARRAAALTAVFVASGAMHVVCIGYMAGGRLSGAMLAFFTLQAPLIMAERKLRVACGLPPASGGSGATSKAGSVLQVAVTAAVILLAAEALFWPPLEAFGIAERGIAEMNALRAGIL